MAVLIGIPTHRRPQLLRECLESLESLAGVSHVEVFVADNDPKRGEGAAFVQSLTDYRWPISAVVVEEPGISAVRNVILRKLADTDHAYLAFVDDDMTVSPQWLSMLLKQTAVGDIIAGPVFYHFPLGTPENVKAAFWTDPRPTGPTEMVSGTCGVLISHRTLYETNFPAFDPAYGLTGGGDKEWFTRMKKLGAAFAWSKEAVAFETVSPERATATWYLRRRFRIGVDDVRIGGRDAALLLNASLSLLLSPLLLARRPSLVTAGKIVRSLGRLLGAVGVRPAEYARRH